MGCQVGSTPHTDALVWTVTADGNEWSTLDSGEPDDRRVIPWPGKPLSLGEGRWGAVAAESRNTLLWGEGTIP